MYKKIAIGISCIALSLALVISGLILQSPSIAFAQSIQVEGNNAGLVILPAGDKFFDLNTMGPGDGLDPINPNPLASVITVQNNYTQGYEVFLKAERTSAVPVGADLYDKLMLEVKFRGNELRNKTQLMSGFATTEISLGTFAPGTSQAIELAVALPEEMGNEYQATGVDVLWTFRAVVPEPEPGPGPGPGPGPDDDDEDEPETIPETPVPLAVVEPIPGENIPQETIPEEIVPLAVPEVDEEEIVEEPIPLAIPKIPKTGGIAPLFFYGSGALLLAGGIIILKKKDDDNQD